MEIFFDRSVEPRYVRAIAQRPWASIETADATFPQTAADTTLAQYAADNQMVVFARDDDFFKLVRERYNCGLLFLHKRNAESPSEVADAVELIRTAYSDHSEIEESVPGQWV
jgi:predicted nuclease of predicted toxin-antitoxin system